MAIALADAVVTATGGATAGPINVSFNCTSATYMVLVTISYSTAAGVPTAFTYNGVSMTPGPSAQSPVGNRLSGVVYLFSPSTGAHNVTITLSNTILTYAVSVSSWSGINSVTSPRTSSGPNGAGANPSNAVTTVSGDLVVDAMANAHTVTVGAGQTQMVNDAAGNAASYQLATGTSTTMAWTAVLGDWCDGIIVFIALSPQSVTPGVLVMTTTSYAPRIDLGITPGVVNLATAKFAPVLSLGIIPPAVALTLVEFAPRLNLTIIPPVTALTLTPYIPVIGLGIIPGVVNLLTALYAPRLDLGVIPPVLSLIVTKYAPLLNLTIIPPVVALVLVNYAPVVGLGIIPGVLALVLTEYAVGLQLGIIPPVKNLLLTPYSLVINLSIIPGVLNMLLTFYTPTDPIVVGNFTPDYPFRGGITLVSVPSSMSVRLDSEL